MKTAPARAGKVSVRLNVWLVTIVTVLVAGFGLVDHILQRRAQEAHLQQQLEAVQARLSVGLPAAVWNYDQEQVGKILHAEMSAPMLDAIVVRSGDKLVDGARRLPDGKITVLDPKDMVASTEQHSFELSLAEGQKTSTVGVVSLHFNRNAIDKALREQLTLLLLQAVVLAVAIVAAASVLFSRLVLRPLRALDEALADIAEGDADLSRRLPLPNGLEFRRVAQNFNAFIDRLHELVTLVQGHAASCADAIDRIAQANRDLSRRTDAQARSLRDTAAAVEELSSSIAQNTRSTEVADGLTQDSGELVSSGGAAMAEVVTTMEQLNQHSHRMSDIVGVIDGIAFQTNILALNAAVEAAGAGENGRGFAVVAAEVRTLAQRSAEAAREIRQLIAESIERVEQGSQRVGRAGESMAAIVSSMRQMSEVLSHISAASHQQEQGIQQVNAAIAAIDKATQDNGRFVEQTAGTTRDVTVQAHELVSLVGAFSVRRDEKNHSA